MSSSNMLSLSAQETSPHLFYVVFFFLFQLSLIQIASEDGPYHIKHLKQP